ncbi:3-dehydroquinate synthase [Calderihabitans maritimus]|uniref:3-dehydroquinate synthase n=1 Tax=Calderihabitans maritimus TaxID=1246530 RepID=A0A1Z5HXN7_9FIRM|nr:3-dehydroquinate synthase [Calderihabitans maritimus]GAW94127.1 3-dehydroquinate synthase [Calderihabitans maritimus]
MKSLQVELGERTYSIVIDQGILPALGKEMAQLGSFIRRCLLVSNPTVYSLYGKTVEESLTAAGFEVVTALVPDGEEAKSLSQADKLYDMAIENRLERRSPVIALGGGVVGDLAGFVAATYMRGVPFVQVPTTLLAQVDSSVGGKVAVNHPRGKNMIGAFYQPRLVWIELNTLDTLSLRELRAGLAEVIKYGVIWDETFFQYLENNLEEVLNQNKTALGYIVYHSCAIKARVVEMDEEEQGLRAILNFGHTIGHALETLTNYATYRHGEAVAIGMVAAAHIAANAGFCSREDVERIKAILTRAGLPVDLPPGLKKEEIISAMYHDKKNLEGKITLVLPHRIGRVELHRGFTAKEITALWR